MRRIAISPIVRGRGRRIVRFEPGRSILPLRTTVEGVRKVEAIEVRLKVEEPRGRKEMFEMGWPPTTTLNKAVEFERAS